MKYGNKLIAAIAIGAAAVLGSGLGIAQAASPVTTAEGTWMVKPASAGVKANYGGPAADNAVLLGKLYLPAGESQLNVYAKATPDSDYTANVFPQFFVYNQPLTSSFAGDLFNVGSGALEAGNDTIDSYYSGSQVITLAKPGYVYVYAFGYASDKSGGTYTVDNANITAVSLNN